MPQSWENVKKLKLADVKADAAIFAQKFIERPHPYFFDKDDDAFAGLVLRDMNTVSAIVSGNNADMALAKGMGVMTHTLLASWADSDHISDSVRTQYWHKGGYQSATTLAEFAGSFPDILVATALAIKRALAEVFETYELEAIENLHEVDFTGNFPSAQEQFPDDKYACLADAVLVDNPGAITPKRYVLEYKTHWTANAGKKRVFPTIIDRAQALFNADALSAAEHYGTDPLNAIVIDAYPAGAAEANGAIATGIHVKVTVFERKDSQSA